MGEEENKQVVKFNNESNDQILKDIKSCKILEEITGNKINVFNKKDLKRARKNFQVLAIAEVYKIVKDMKTKQEVDSKKRNSLWTHLKRYVVIGGILIIIFTTATLLNKWFGINLPTDLKTLLEFANFLS